MEHVRDIAKRLIANMEDSSNPSTPRFWSRLALIDYRLALQGRGTFDEAYLTRDKAIKAGVNESDLDDKCYRMRQLWAAGKL